MAIRPIKHCSIIKTGETSKHDNNTGINGLTIVHTIGAIYRGQFTIQFNAIMQTGVCDRGYLQGKIFHNIIQCEMQPSVGFHLLILAGTSIGER